MRGNAQKIRQTHATPRQAPLDMNTQQQKCSHSHLGSPRTETSQECNTRPPTFGYGHEKRRGNVKKPRALCTRKRSCAIVRGSAERWQSGRLYLTRNQALGNQPRVRIPPSPPITLAKPVSDWTQDPARRQSVRGFSFLPVDLAPPLFQESALLDASFLETC